MSQTIYERWLYGDNIRMTYDDVLYFVHANSIPGLLFTVDVEKAFNSVSGYLMKNLLSCLAFQSIIKWFHVYTSAGNTQVSLV